MFNKKTEKLETIVPVAKKTFEAQEHKKQFQISEEDFIKAILHEDSGHIKAIHYTEHTIIVDWYRSV